MAPASGAQNTVDTAHVVAFLASLRELRQTGPVGFVSAAGQPDVPVILALAGAPVRCVSHGEFIPRINLVERVCSHAGESAGYDALASRIAAHLGWVAVEEQAERQVWPLTVMAEGTVALVR